MRLMRMVELQSWLVGQVASELACAAESVPVDAPFEELGLSSQQAVRISGDLEELLGQRLSATLLWEFPTIARLAAHLAGGGGAAVTAAGAAAPAAAVPIAIIGIGCRFPGADGPEAFWQLLRDGVDTIREVPPDRWDAGRWYSPGPALAGKAVTRWGGFLDDVRGFDAAAFAIPPREAESMDPQQWLLLEAAWEALEDAGLPVDSLAGRRAGVFVGISAGDWAQRQLADPSRIDMYASTGAAHSIAANRISYALDLRGPSVAIDTACSASLVAVHLACQGLRLGECEVALAGGVNVMLEPALMVAFSQAGMMAADGRCKAFDARADGYVRGEGCGMVVLKPLAAARRDGDTVQAVILGSGVNQDGRTNGLTAPNVAAQRAVIADALRAAGIAGDRVDYVEAHGTGTPLGDPIEMDALADMYLPGRAPERPLVVGSVKTNLGHLEAAAGIAGLIKTALSLRHGEIPPHLHLRQPNPQLRLEQRGIRIATARMPWPARPGVPRVAAISSFGFGGTNAHLILAADDAPAATGAEAGGDPAPESAARGWLLPLSARSREALGALAARWSESLETSHAPLSTLCAAAAHQRAHHRYRACAVAASSTDMRARLASLATGAMHAPAPLPAAEGGTVFVFSGHGSQWPGMGRQLLDEEPAFAQALRAAADALAGQVERGPLELLGADDEQWLRRMDLVQPALWAMQVALAALWRSWGVEPAAVVGHSVGEVAAATVAGALSLHQGARLVARRSRLLASLDDGGTMALVRLPPAAAHAAAAGVAGVSVAAINGPSATVVAGREDALRRLVDRLQAQGVECSPLPVQVAAHSALVEPLCGELLRELETLAPRPGALPFYSTVLAAPLDGTALTPSYWVRNLRETVRFAATIERLLEDGFTRFVEVSPHPLLAAAVTEALAAHRVSGVVVESLRRPREFAGEPSERTRMLEALGRLYVGGAAVDWRRLYARPTAAVPLPRYPWQRRPASALPAPAPVTPAQDLRSRWTWVSGDAPEPALAAVAAGRWLLLGEGEVVEAVQRRLQAAGAACRSLAPRQLAATSLSDTGLRGVVWFAPETAAGGAVPERTLATLHAAVATTRELEAVRAGSAAPELWMVTRGAQTLGAEPPVLEHAVLWGLASALAVERPPWGGLIDLDRAGEVAGQVETLVQVLLQHPRGRAQAIRDGRLFARRLRGWPRAGPPGRFAVAAGTGVLITGGLGALGRHAARWLAAAGADHLLLLGRSGAAAAGLQFDAFRDDLRRQGVTFDVVAADVADAGQLEAALAGWRGAHPDVPLRGVLHLAGVADRRLVAELPAELLADLVAAKIAGAWNVHAAFPDAGDLDFFVLYSSAVGVLPAPAGMGAYAAANAFLDALASWRRAAGLPSLSVQWGPWLHGGMATRGILPDLLEHFGVTGLEPARALAELGELLRAPEEALVAIVDADWDQVSDSHAALAGTPLLEVADLRSGRLRPGRRRSAETGVPVDADVPALRAFLREEIGAALHLRADDVALDLPLRELGMDSLMLMTLILAVERRWATRFYPREVAAQPDVEALAAYLATEIRRAADAPDSVDDAPPDSVGPWRPLNLLHAAGQAVPGPVSAAERNPAAAFVLSSPRSGSTLLRVMLAGHPALFAPPELNLLPFADMRQRRDVLRDSYLDEGLPRAFMHLLAIDADASRAMIDDMVEQNVPVHQVYARLQQLAAGRLLVDKSPAYAMVPAALARAEAVFDCPRYVFLVRHPGAVVESFIRRRLAGLLGDDGRDPQGAAEHVWATSNANVIDFLATIPEERRHQVRFEDLVREPRRTAEALCAFLGVEFEEALLTPYQGGRMADGIHPTSLAIGDPGFLEHTGIDAGLADAWRQRRPPRPPGALVRRIAAELGYELQDDAFAENARRRARLRAPLGGTWEPLVPVQLEGSGVPLFLVHPASGAVYPYYELARELGTERPLYVLQDVALGGARAPLASVDAYAREYVAAIRTVQPRGPYLLGGWSFGGHVAVAMARMLQQDGEPIAALLLLDSEAPVDLRAMTLRQRLRHFRRVAGGFRRRLGDLVPYVRDGFYLLREANRNRLQQDQPRMNTVQYLRWAWQDAWRRRMAGDAPVAREIVQWPEFKEVRVPSDSMLAGFALFRHHVRLVRDEVPRPFDGDVILLRARDQHERRFHSTPALGWDAVVRGAVRVIEVPGNHVTLVRSPHVQKLAATMNDCLRLALRD